MKNYFIDFERINQLTTSTFDDPKGGFNNSGRFTYTISRKIIQNFLEIYLERDSRVANPQKVEEAINQLRFNKILVSKSDVRDNKLNEILE
jgi:hypothetical protein